MDFLFKSLFLAFSAAHSAAQMAGKHYLWPCTFGSQRKYFLTCWCPALHQCMALWVCPWHWADQGEWKGSYDGARHRCPAPPPIHATACSVCVLLWHCTDWTLCRSAGGPISRVSMSVKLHRECEWNRLLLKYVSSRFMRCKTVLLIPKQIGM